MMTTTRLLAARLAVFVPVVVVLLALPCVAEGEDAYPELNRDVIADFRGKLMIGFSCVFVLIVGYLVVSHRRNAQLKDEIEFLKGRVDALDK